MSARATIDDAERATIDDLPDEVLDQIAGYVSGHPNRWSPAIPEDALLIDIENMWAAAAVCRRWRRIFGAPRFREPCQNAYSLFKTVKIICLEDAWLGASGERLVKYST